MRFNKTPFTLPHSLIIENSELLLDGPSYHPSKTGAAQAIIQITGHELNPITTSASDPIPPDNSHLHTAKDTTKARLVTTEISPPIPTILLIHLPTLK